MSTSKTNNTITPEFIDDFMRDIPRGVASRYLSQQSVPQARWQLPEDILNSEALA